MAALRYLRESARIELAGALTFDTVPATVARIEAAGVSELRSIDLADLDEIDSAGVACLLWVAAKKSGARARVTLLNPDRRLEKLIEVAGLRDWFDAQRAPRSTR